MDISTDQVRLWINQGIGIADRAVKALERRVEQNEDTGMLPGEYALPGEEPTAPAPSCDAPSCGCVDGEDCEANRPCDCTDSEDCRLDVGTGWRPKGCGSWIEGSEEPPKDARRAEDIRTGGSEGFARPALARSREVRTAVMALQKALGVGEDGIVGEQTMRAIGDISTGKRPVYSYVQDGTRLTLLKDGVPCADVPPDLIPILPFPLGMNVRPSSLRPELTARLDGLDAKLDALAERKADETTRFNPLSRANMLKDADLSARVTVDGASITLSKGARGRCFPIQELWDLPDVSEPLATMSGIQSRLDDLAKRLPDADAHMIRVVMPTEIDRNCETDTEVWHLDKAFDGHRAPFKVGDAVTDSSAYHGIHEVLSIERRVKDGAIVLKLKRHLGFVFDREAF